MSKFAEAVAKYKKDLEGLGIAVDETLLTAVTKGLGPSIYLADASLVSSSDPEELARVKNNFLIKKLGMADGPALGAAIDAAIEKYGKSNRNKHRAVLYYILVKNLKKESVYAK